MSATGLLLLIIGIWILLNITNLAHVVQGDLHIGLVKPTTSK